MVFRGRRLQRGGILPLLNKYRPIGIKTVNPAGPMRRRKRGKALMSDMIQKIKKTVRRGGTLFTPIKRRIPHRVINSGLDYWYRSYQKKKGEPVTGLRGYSYI